MYIDESDIEEYLIKDDTETLLECEIILAKLNQLLSQDHDLAFTQEHIKVAEEFLFIGEEKVYEYIISLLYKNK